MELQEQLKEIKTQLRLSMNGVVSQSMREKGLDYKLNFGVELPRIKEIASGYEQNHDLAQTLWKENVRESKILAAMLQPVDSFFPEIADIWVEDMHYSEIAELTCMNLFQYLPYAPAKAFRWIADDREYFQLCGFLLAARLFIRGLQLNERAESEFFDQSLTAMQCESFSVRKAAMLSLKKYGLQGHSQAS
ncbi:MAG: DNA alkylation repair protein, partial [Bacteroides sp.]